jgi:glycosyltransferase involved in cell wall biosynthesis
MISFVIPAHNEESVLGATLDAIFSAARSAGVEFEVVVVNDASTDGTKQIATGRGARVVDVELRKISAVRNVGARTSIGDVLIFVDADTIMPLAVLQGVLSALENGAVAGGARVVHEKNSPAVARFIVDVFAVFWFGCKWAAGCFVFSRRKPFEAVGGFDERYYASEEWHLSRALKRQGRFVIVREKVITSGRKLRMYSGWQLAKLSCKFLARGIKGYRHKEGLEFWYGERREDHPRPK